MVANAHLPPLVTDETRLREARVSEWTYTSDTFSTRRASATYASSTRAAAHLRRAPMAACGRRCRPSRQCSRCMRATTPSSPQYATSGRPRQASSDHSAPLLLPAPRGVGQDARKSLHVRLRQKPRQAPGQQSFDAK